MAATLDANFQQFYLGYATKELFTGSILNHFTDVSSKVVGGNVLHIPYVESDVTLFSGYNKTPEFGATYCKSEKLTMTLTHFYTKPRGVEKVVEEWQKFNVLETSMQLDLQKIKEEAENTILTDIYSQIDSSRIITTTGTTTVGAGANGASAKLLTYTDIVNIKKAMDKDNCPKIGRYLALNSEMYNNLLLDTQISKLADFGKSTAEEGEVMKIAGLNIIERSWMGAVNSTSSATTVLDLNDADANLLADKYAGLAFVKGDYVYSAFADPKLYYKADDVNIQGDVYSFSFNEGAILPRPATKRVGVYKIIQG